MSATLWNKLPYGFLKKQFKAWNKLDHDVKGLIVELAEEQKFKCVHCPRERNLMIEHDHYPEYGSGDKLTVFNIRGLVCQRCNWHLMIYEKDMNGEYRSFDEVSSYISDGEWESYIYAYDCRVVTLNENRLKQSMGTAKYWRRRLFLNKFDDWKEWVPRKRLYPWHWGFDEIKERKRHTIRTPEQFVKVLAAIVEYLKGELAKNPDWRPSEEMVPALLRIKAFVDELYPAIEARYLEIMNEAAAATTASMRPTSHEGEEATLA
jgi:Recombination endonuclease VII